MQVRFAIDATSVAGDADHANDAPLFSFRGRNASPIGKGIYQVQGEFTGAAGEHPLMVQLETLNEHSALFLLSFQADKADFGPSWTQLLSNVVPFAPARWRADQARPRLVDGSGPRGGLKADRLELGKPG